MARKAVIDAVEARLAAEWTHSVECPIRGAYSISETPADASNFLLVQYPMANETPISVGSPGSNVFREEGVFRVMLHYARYDDIETALEWIEEIATIYRGQSFDGVMCHEVDSPPLDDRTEEGNYLLFPVAVVYDHDIYS